jgi:leucine dehydrogenase
LQKEGANVVGCDIDDAAITRAKAKFPGIKIVSTDAIFDEACDVFSPSALGGAINASTRPRIKAKIIAGAANNQLATPDDGAALFKAGVLYAPDYAINAGGLINIYHERDAGGYKREAAFKHAEGIGQTVRKILSRSKEERLPSHVVADRMAEERFLK